MILKEQSTQNYLKLMENYYAGGLKLQTHVEGSCACV